MTSFKQIIHPTRSGWSDFAFDLVDEIGLAQPTVSQHLKELKHLGLIKGNVEGTSVCYCIDTGNWIKMKEIMSEFLDQDMSKGDCC